MTFKLETLSQSIDVYAAIKARGELKTEYFLEGDLMYICTKGLVWENYMRGEIWNPKWTKSETK